VEDHGGSIEVLAKHEPGASVQITLPGLALEED